MWGCLFQSSGIHPCDLREAVLESDKNHSENFERNTICPTFDAHTKNVKSHSLIDTEPEISAGSENCIQRNNNYFKNTVIIPMNKLQIRTACLLYTSKLSRSITTANIFYSYYNVLNRCYIVRCV